MTIRNLNYLFKPTSIAVVGASDRPGSIGAVLMENLLGAEFQGPVMPVNPRHQEIAGRPVSRCVASLPETPDLALIASPPHSVPNVIEDLATRGTKAAIVITAGLRDGHGAMDGRLCRALQEAARPALLRVVGPNCVGLLVPGSRLNASFAHLQAKPGGLAFVAQSGAVVTSILDWATPRGIGFSHLISLGDMIDVDFGDMLDYLASDSRTRAILLYMEAVTHPRKFLSAARAASRMKPVLVVKAGRHPEGARAAATHTGALAGSDAVYDAAFRRAGMLRVIGLDELFDAVEILALCRPPKGDRLAIVTNGGGMGVLAADAVIDCGSRLATFADETIRSLNRVLPATWSHGNPVDIIGDATGERYAATLEQLWGDQGIDAILVLNCPTAVSSQMDAAQAVIDQVAGRPAPPVVAGWVGGDLASQARRRLEEHGIPAYETPGKAVRAIRYLVDYARSQKALMETPPSVPEAFSPRTDLARKLIQQALDEGRNWLGEAEAKSVVAAYGLPVVPTRTARTSDEAATIAAEIGHPVALKILSPDITHKSDVGGVALNLPTGSIVRETAERMIARIRGAQPKARLQGFTVQAMVNRPNAYELIVGVQDDPQFGPVILFGQGGVAVELLDDSALSLPPLNMGLARELVDRTRIGRLLRGFRNRPAVDLDALALSLIRIAQIAVDLPQVIELDVNPLLADEHGVVALDARIRVAEPAKPGVERLSIRPYPKELESEVRLANGRSLLLRPILPEDEISLQQWFLQLDPETIRMRFFLPMKVLDHVQAARFTQIDYEREMALVLTEVGIPGKARLYGVVRLAADPDNERAEFALVVVREMTGLGLGIVMLRRIVDYARERGISEVWGDVLRENHAMTRLCEAFGFERRPVPDEPELIRVTLRFKDCPDA